MYFQVSGDRFQPGTVVLFGQYFGYCNWRNGEFKAWKEFVAEKDSNIGTWPSVISRFRL